MSRLQNYPIVTRKLFYVGIGRVENTVWIIYRSTRYNGLRGGLRSISTE